MYGIGDRVVYGAHGVCRVSGTEERLVDRRRCVYLVLEPVAGSTTRYLIPTGNAAAMAKLSPLMNKEELETLLDSSGVRDVVWVQDENRRKQLYRELISCCDRMRLTRAVYSLYRHREQQNSVGRKVHMCDENFLHDAERILAGEIENILNIDFQEARKYLQEKLSI